MQSAEREEKNCEKAGKKPYSRPTLQKRERLVEVTEGVITQTVTP